MLYQIYGLVFRSAIPLPGATPAPADANAEDCIDVRCGEPRPIPAVPPEGELLHEERYDDGSGCAYVREAGGYRLRFYRYAEFFISGDLRSIHAWVGVGEDPEGLTIYLAGHVAAFLLAMKGYTALHASAVAGPQRILMILGHRCYGKSTLAAALCRQGFELFTDDLMPLTLSAERVVAHRGAHTLRLRPHAAERLALSSPLTPSCDGRLLHRPAFARSERMELGAIVCLKPSEQEAPARARRLPPLDAFGELLAHSRDARFKAPGALGADLAVHAELARSVPCHELRVNWGSESPANVAAAVAGLL